MSQKRYLIVGTPNIDIESWEAIRALGSTDSWSDAVFLIQNHFHYQCFGQWLLIDLHTGHIFNEHHKDFGLKPFRYIGI